MNKGDALNRFAGQDGVGGAVAFLAADTREIDYSTAFGYNSVLGFVLAAMLPFEIAGGGKQAAALGHAILEDCLLRGGFAAGVEQEPAIGQLRSERRWKTEKALVCLVAVFYVKPVKKRLDSYRASEEYPAVTRNIDAVRVEDEKRQDYQRQFHGISSLFRA